MAAKTFLQLVNTAILESKATLDALTPANFAEPPRTILYDHFKNWINIHYTELFEERPEWFFRKERTIVSIWPRLYLGGASASLAVGDILEGRSSGVRVTVTGTHTHEEAESNEASEITISVDYDDVTSPTQLILRETFDRVNNVPEEDVGYLIGLGYYDFKSLVPGLQSIDPSSFKITKIPTATDGTRLYQARQQYPVTFVEWPNEFEVTPLTGNAPRYIAQTPSGDFALYPQPNEKMDASFDYTRRINEMVTYDDVPEALPEQYHDYLVWKAVEEFADFDNNPALFRRAQKHVRKYDYFLFRDQLPTIRFEKSRF